MATPQDPAESQSDRAAFEELSASGERQGLVAEFWDFLKYNKKWWLLPVVLVILLLGMLVTLGGTPLGPFIYALW